MENIPRKQKGTNSSQHVPSQNVKRKTNNNNKNNKKIVGLKKLQLFNINERNNWKHDSVTLVSYVREHYNNVLRSESFRVFFFYQGFASEMISFTIKSSTQSQHLRLFNICK